MILTKFQNGTNFFLSNKNSLPVYFQIHPYFPENNKIIVKIITKNIFYC